MIHRPLKQAPQDFSAFDYTSNSRQYYYGKDQLVSLPWGRVPYYQTNAHGDVVSVTNSSGQVVNTYSYDPWGNNVTTNEQVRNPYTYAGAYGYYRDATTGLCYLRARYYKPEIYRFLTKDPHAGDQRSPLSMNPYIYCQDNPLNKVDPSGLMVQAMFDGYTFSMARDGKIILSVSAVTGNPDTKGWGQEKGPIPPGMWYIKQGTVTPRSGAQLDPYGPQSINLEPANRGMVTFPRTGAYRDLIRIHSGRKGYLEKHGKLANTIGCIRMTDENVQKVVDILKSVDYDIPLLVEYKIGSPYRAYRLH